VQLSAIGKYGAWTLLAMVFSQGIGYSTALVLVRSPEAVLMAVDSKEVYTEYRDGIPSTRESLICKYTTTGPFYVVASGIVRGTDGFNALRVAQDSYRAGDAFDVFSERVRENVSGRLGALVEMLGALNIPDFRDTYTNHVILQVAVFGVADGVPKVRVQQFEARYSASGKASVTSTTMSCPGECSNGRAGYLLGAHEAMDQFVRSDPKFLAHANVTGIEKLIGLEYAARPDIVGGPVSLIRIDKAGNKSVRGGVCAAEESITASNVSPPQKQVMDPVDSPAPVIEMPVIDNSRKASITQLLTQAQPDFDQKLATIAHILCHRDIFRYSQTRDGLRQVDTLGADVELVDGVEKYVSLRRGNKAYRSMREAGGAWSSGEIGAILRITRDLTGSDGAVITGISSEGEDGMTVLSFRHEDLDDAWTLTVDSLVHSMPFEGKVWISPENGEIVRIQWRATNLPSKTEVSSVEWSVSFEPALVGGEMRSVPVKSTYTVVYAGKRGRTDRNETLFSNFRLYGSEVRVSFEGDGTSAN
jgi:hypothetical protein